MTDGVLFSLTTRIPVLPLLPLQQLLIPLRRNSWKKMEDGRATKRIKLENRHVSTIRPLVPPACVLEELPVSEQVSETVGHA